MFDTASNHLRTILHNHPWASELAGILPLSALIDFVEVPPKLHIFQLSGAAPIWSWPITPAGSRLLLSLDQPSEESCFLDRFGRSTSLLGLDGFYGDRFFLSNPETIRLCISATQTHIIHNLHPNMRGENLRLQNLEIIHVSRLPVRSKLMPRGYMQNHLLLNFLRMRSARYLGVSILGWALFLAMISMSIILQAWVSLSFLILMPVTGSVVFVIYGSNPRRLLVNTTGTYNRLVVAAEHENAANWTVFYGESTILNSLLNRPLQPTGSKRWLNHLSLLRMTLRALILGQWGLVLGAASLKDWNSYFVCFWILFCIFVHAYIIPASLEAKEWCKFSAGIQFKRYKTKLSSRRALLNVIIALNPDTFTYSLETGQEDRTRFHEGAMKWVDSILKCGPSRTKWEQATLKAMNEAPREFSLEGPAVDIKHEIDFPSADWNAEYERDYWSSFIPEGIYMAALIREKANLPGRKVRTLT